MPESILQVAFDSTRTAARGMPSAGEVNFDNIPVFKLDSDAAAKGVRPVAWFATDKPLRSGWAWGNPILRMGWRHLRRRQARGDYMPLGLKLLSEHSRTALLSYCSMDYTELSRG